MDGQRQTGDQMNRYVADNRWIDGGMDGWRLFDENFSVHYSYLP